MRDHFRNGIRGFVRGNGEDQTGSEKRKKKSRPGRGGFFREEENEVYDMS
jgi:hypothetical protein